MHVFEMVVIVTIAGLIAAVAIIYLNNRKVNNSEFSQLNQRLGQLEVLKRRVETLESIVTDNGYDLKQEINGLK